MCFIYLCISFSSSVLQHKDERRRKDENILKQSHQLVAEVIEHTNFLHSLLVKTAIYGYDIFTFYSNKHHKTIILYKYCICKYIFSIL